MQQRQGGTLCRCCLQTNPPRQGGAQRRTERGDGAKRRARGRTASGTPATSRTMPDQSAPSRAETAGAARRGTQRREGQGAQGGEGADAAQGSSTRRNSREPRPEAEVATRRTPSTADPSKREPRRRRNKGEGAAPGGWARPSR